MPLVLAPGAEAFIHWTSGAIGRAELDGTNVDRAFITDTSAPYGVAVSASHLYWADSFRKIGRAERNGANVQTTFLAGVDGAEGVAVDDHHVYWAIPARSAAPSSTAPASMRASLSATTPSA